MLIFEVWSRWTGLVTFEEPRYRIRQERRGAINFSISTFTHVLQLQLTYTRALFQGYDLGVF